MALINCEIHFVLIYYSNCVIVSGIIANQKATFAITNKKLYVFFVALSFHEISI